MVEELTLRSYSEGDYVITEGEIGREMFIVVTGTLSIKRNGGLLRPRCGAWSTVRLSERVPG